jgi:phospholipase/lecithinase/hemolysin
MKTTNRITCGRYLRRVTSSRYLRRVTSSRYLRRVTSGRYLRRVTWTRVIAQAVMLFISAHVPSLAQRKADLSRLVVVGDSLSAGYQNGSLLDVQQPHGYASLVAAQAGVPLTLPLIAAPGLPNVFQLVSPGPPPVILRAPGVSIGRDDFSAQATDLAVPGANVQDALTTRPDFPIDSLTDLVLGLPGLFGGVSKSQVEWAETLAPTTIIVWLGNNDALSPATQGDASLLTPLTDFQASYTEVMSRLSATGATLVAANIPDVASIAFLTPAEKVAASIGLPLSVIGPVLGIGAGDFVVPDAFPHISAILNGLEPGPLPGNLVLDAGEVATIRAAVREYNAFIAAQAQAHGAALVDIHALVDQLHDKGLVAGGQRLNLDFLGGLFSLDGIHPTNTGYALFANEFIHALNTRFAAGIPPVSVEQIKQSDPLVLPGVGHPAAALAHVNAETAASVRAVIGGRN